LRARVSSADPVELAETVDAARLLAGGNVATEFARDAHDLSDGAELGAAVLVSDVVLDADADVQAHGHRHHVNPVDLKEPGVGQRRDRGPRVVQRREPVGIVGEAAAAASTSAHSQRSSSSMSSHASTRATSRSAASCRSLIAKDHVAPRSSRGRAPGKSTARVIDWEAGKV
jgi:hypothetical protein